MSTKTLRKRIALVAVSAMGFGLLTSVAANATWTDWATNGDIQDSSSVGLVGPISGSSNLTAKATLLNTGTLKIATGGDDVLTGLTVSSGAVISKTATMSKLATTQSCVDEVSGTEITPTGAAGTTFTVSGYTGGDCATGLTGLKAVLTVTIASTSLAGTPSASNSVAVWTSSTGIPTTEGLDDTGKSSAIRAGHLYLSIIMKDVYNAPIKTAGALTVEVSSGAVVSVVKGRGSTSAGTYTTAVLGDTTNANGYATAQIDEKTAGTGWSGTVKVSYNGVLIATKSGKITGDVAKISVTPIAVGSNDGVATDDAFAFNAYDASGNQVEITNPDTKLLMDSSSNLGVLTDAKGNAAYPNDPTADDPSGYGDITCATAGKSDVVLYFVNAAGTIVKSPKATFNCGGAADSYKASFDKASYKQGDIATLTVTFYDVAGNLANSVTAINDATTADQVISAPQMVRVTEAGTFVKNKKPNGAGARVYTFTVGTDSGIVAGSYNAIVSFPTINKSPKNGTDQSVPYTITSSGTSISNAEVLAAIVKLIASINKQITALQKLLTKKK